MFRDPTEILADLTGWNVWDLINEANVTVSGLRSVRLQQPCNFLVMESF